MARIPRAAGKTQRQPPTKEQLEAAKAHPEGAGFIANFLRYTGMRLGEAQAVQVKDIDLNEILYGIKGTITVSKSYLWHGNKPVLETTKTVSSVRKVPIFAPLRPLLVERMKGLSPTDFIISGASTPLTHTEYHNRWNSYWLDLGMARYELRKYNRADGSTYTQKVICADVTAHQFRHEMATALYEAGVPELVAQKILGHKDITTTHRIYTHIREMSLEASAVALNEYYLKSL